MRIAAMESSASAPKIRVGQCGCCASQHVLYRLGYPRASDLDCKLPRRARSHSFADPTAQALVAQEAADAISQLRRSLRRDQEAVFSVLHEIRDGAHGSGNNGKPCGHG